MTARTVATWDLMLSADRSTHEEATTVTNSARCASRDACTVRGMRYEMLGFMEQCVERYLDLANVDIHALRPVATLGLDDHAFSEEDWTETGSLAPITEKVIMKILYDARMYRFDMLHSKHHIHHTQRYVLEGAIG